MTDFLSWGRIKKTLLDPLVPESIRGFPLKPFLIMQLKLKLKRINDPACLVYELINDPIKTIFCQSSHKKNAHHLFVVCEILNIYMY